MSEVQNTSSLDAYQREKMFEYLFTGGDEPLMRLKKQALACQLNHSNLRIISWKMFLGLLSTPPRVEEWVKEIARQREHYQQLKDNYTNLSAHSEEDDPNINNPLSLDTTSSWSKYFESEQLRKTILQDVDRTYPEYTYFQQQWVKDMMMNILFIYAKENTEVSYKQGMHELLAPVIYTLDEEKMTPIEGSALSQLMNKNYIESDAFTIFERLMKTTGCWFITKSPSEKPNTTPVAGSASPQSKKEAQSPVLTKCQHIYHNLLKARDPGLYSYISSLKIEPQLYLLRWIRLLFGREFPLVDTLTLWDCIFAFDKTFMLIDYIAVSMLINIREELLSSDQNGVLQLLFKYPFNVSIDNFVEHARDMAKPKRAHISSSPRASHTSHTPNTHTNNTTTNTNPNPNTNTNTNNNALRVGTLQPRALSLGFPKQPPSNPTVAHSQPGGATEQELIQLKLLHSNIAIRLENIVFNLQNNLSSNNTSPSAPSSSDTILLTVAELKQIKDVMMGHLPLEALPSLQPDLY